MGLLDRLQNGIAAGAQTASDAFMTQFKSQVEQERQDALIRAQESSQKRMVDYKVGVEDQQRAKVGGLLSSANDDAALDNLRKNYGDNSLTKDDVLPEELKAHAPAERESINAQIAALERSGYTGEADKMRNRLDRVDDNERADAKDAWAMAHGDKQLAAQEKHYRALEGQAASALNLKKQERQDLSDAMDAYTVADGNLKMLDKTADEKTLKAATFARDAAAIRLQPYGIKIGGDGQGSFHASVLEDSTTGEKGLAITNQKTGDSTYKTAAELKGGKAGEGVEAKSARLFGDGKPKEEAKTQASAPSAGRLATSARQSKPASEPKIELLSKSGKDGWNVKIDGKYTSMTTEELKRRGIHPDINPTQLQF